MPLRIESLHPSALLIFDGDCGFCTSCVHWLERNLPVMPSASPFQWTDLDAVDLTAAQAAERVWLVTVDRYGSTHHHGGHLAVAELLRRQPSTAWRFAGVLLATAPFSWMASVGYALISRYRYLLPGGTPACRIRSDT